MCRDKEEKMAKVKKQIKTPKIKLSNEDIANLSDAEFKPLVIRMLTELVEYGCKTEEEVKAMKSEIKENAQGINSTGNSNQQFGPEGRNKHSTRTE